MSSPPSKIYEDFWDAIGEVLSLHVTKAVLAGDEEMIRIIIFFSSILRARAESLDAYVQEHYGLAPEEFEKRNKEVLKLAREYARNFFESYRASGRNFP